MKRLTVLVMGIILLASACSPVSQSTPVPVAATETLSAPERFIVFGDISDDPAEVIEGTQPIADYIAAKLADQGFTGGKVRVASSTEEMAALLRSGDVDVYFDSTFPATLISDQTGGEVVLRRWKYGVEEYHSVIFASVESGITSVEDLKGKIIVMDAPYSTSGYMLPAVYLLDKGLTLTAKPNYNTSVAPDEVGFVFSYDDENTLQWVLSGFAGAGVVDDYNFDVAFPEDVTANLVVLARTEPEPRQVMVVRPGLEPEVVDALKAALMGMDEDPAAADALDAFLTTKFDEFPEGLSAAQLRMRSMMEKVLGIQIP